MATYIGKRIVPVHCGKWDMSKAYEMLSIVLEETSGDSYIARRAVPSGTAITDTHYWMLHSLYSQQIKDMSDQLAATEQRLKSDNDATEAAIRQDNQATLEHVDSSLQATTEELTETVNSARSAMTQQKASFDQTVVALNTRMDEVLAAGTGTGETEILDARVDRSGYTYDSLGTHIRSIDTDQDKKRNQLEAKLDRMMVEVRVSNNIMDPERLDQDTWDPDAYKGHYVSVNASGTISGISATEMYAFCGNWNIRGLGLSGKTIVCNYAIRFLSLTKTPLGPENFHRGVGECISILTVNGGASKGAEIQLPEFDENEFPYLNFTIQYWENCVLFGGEKVLYFSGKTPFSAVDVDEYAVKVIAPEGIVISDVVEQIREHELPPEKASFFRLVSSTNLFNRADDGITPLWAYGNLWEVSDLYYGTKLIPIPASRKIITNFRFRGLSAYSNEDEILYDGVPEDRSQVCPETTVVASLQQEGHPGQVYDLSGISDRFKYIRMWIFKSGFATQEAKGWYLADAENYKEGLWEEYFDPYYLIKSEYIPGYKTSELIDDVGFVKSGDPVSTLENDAGYLTEAIERVSITPKNSDRIMLLGDSYTESSFTIRGKAYINKLSLFSDYVFENMALSGDIYYGNIDRIRTGAQQYGLSFEEARPKFAMMCCFTNDIKTLTADQYADALRRACEEIIGRGVTPIICTEYHAIYNIPNIVSVNEQVAREYGCPCWDIASIVQIVRGTDHAPYWGGSHAGTRPNALQSDNYEKFLQTLERPNHSIKLFRLRDSYAETAIEDLMFHTNEERAQLFREICVGHTRLADPAMVDNCTNAQTTRENSEYAKLMKGTAVAFPKVALASVVIPGDYRSTKSLSLKLTADKAVQVYVKDISAGSYVRPRRYVRFDFTDAVTNIPAIGDVYRCEDFGNANLTVADIVMGQGDGDAIGYILCSGVPGNNSYDNHGGTLTKHSGSGDDTIAFTYKSVGYRAEDLMEQELGGWTELAQADGVYPLSDAQLSTCIFRDRVDFLIVADEAFSLTSIEADWYGSQSKTYTRKEMDFISNLARDTDEWIGQPTFGEAGQQDSFWNVTPTTASDGCYPYGCTSLVEVDSDHGISLMLDADAMGLHNKFKSGTAILEVWARYFPDEYTDGSGNQITEDSYDYAVLKAEIGRGTTRSTFVTLKERVNTHWKIVQFPVELTGGMSNYNFHMKLYSDKPLQIAKVSLKKA